MTRRDEAPREAVRATCSRIGLQEARNMERISLTDQGYVKEWIQEQEDKIAQEKRFMKALEIAEIDSKSAQSSAKYAMISVAIAAISTAIALASLFVKIN